MTPNTKFEITRPDVSARNVSGKYASAALRGIALGAHTTDDTSFGLAEHNNFIGFLTRPVVAGGLTLTQRVFGVPGTTPSGFESPFTAGEEVSLEKAHEIEIEDDASGAGYLYSGTGQITGATTIPQAVSLKTGQWRKTQSSEVVNGFLTAVWPTGGSDGGLRVRIEVVQ